MANNGFSFGILGPVDVRDGGQALAIGSQKQRALLAMLLLSANRVVSTSALIDGLWGEDPPATAGSALQVHVGKLRQALSRRAGTSPIVTRAPGYAIDVDGECFDLARYEDLARRGREMLALGRPDEASPLLERALGCWRGPALADVAAEPFAYAAVVRLDESRLATMADRFDAELDRGGHAPIVSELREITALHPLRERFWEQLILALYRCGSQADALEAFQSARTALLEQVGVGPSGPLRDLETAVLNQSPSLDASRHRLPAQPTLASTIVGESEAAISACIDRHGRHFPLTGRVTIGRHPSSSLVIDDAKASRDHAVIRASNKEFILHDARSTNGTFVNGERVVERVLCDGDTITVGQTELFFHLDGR